MSYMHIQNLYKAQAILAFRECYAMEKIHGTSAHVRFCNDGTVFYSSGGEKHERFVELFDHLSALHFSCQEYDHYAGFTRFWYDGGDLFEARAVLGMRIADTLGKPGANYLKIRVECHPLWGSLGRHRPTAEQALAMYRHSERIATREAG